jgi:hypothetical protein
MAEEYDDDELELIRKHRAKKAAAQRQGRKVTVRGKHDSGADYEFELDGDEADRVISRHRALWSDDDGPDGEGDGGGDGEDAGEGAGDGEGEAAQVRVRKPKAAAAAPAQPVKRSPYFKR